jgi:hypothetical protein
MPTATTVAATPIFFDTADEVELLGAKGFAERIHKQKEESAARKITETNAVRRY